MQASLRLSLGMIILKSHIFFLGIQIPFWGGSVQILWSGLQLLLSMFFTCHTPHNFDHMQTQTANEQHMILELCMLSKL